MLMYAVKKVELGNLYASPDTLYTGPGPIHIHHTTELCLLILLAL